jgi:hypothetical protein
VELRERGWEGLPPPPVFTTGKPNRLAMTRKIPVQLLSPHPWGFLRETSNLRFLTPLLSNPSPPQRQTLFLRPLSHSRHPLASPLYPTSRSQITSDDESPIDPTAITPHGTFHLQDGNVEVLCGNTLFRVHTSILSFHSPALRRMFDQTSLSSAESTGGCPRISSSDTATDFATLLKIIYLPGYVTPPPCR